MKAKQLLQGWRRCWDLRTTDWIRSRDGSWPLLPDRTSVIHSRCETSNSPRQGCCSLLPPEIGFVISSGVKQGSRYSQAVDGHIVRAAVAVGSTTVVRASALTHLRSITKTHRWIMTKSEGTSREVSQKMSGWSGKPGFLRGGRGQDSKGFAMYGFQQYQRRTLYGGGSPEQAVWALIGVNAFVFFLWQMGPNDLMARHFQASWDALKNGRIHTLVTSAFSQASPSHLFTNMIGLYFFGSELAHIFGPKYLVSLYLAGGIAASVGHLLYWAYYVPWSRGIPRKYYDPRHTPGAMGASGAVNAIIILNVLLNPTRIVYVNLFIPVPAALLGLLLIGSDLWSARNDSSPTSHAGHLAGAAVGIIAYFVK